MSRRFKTGDRVRVNDSMYEEGDILVGKETTIVCPYPYADDSYVIFGGEYIALDSELELVVEEPGPAAAESIG